MAHDEDEFLRSQQAIYANINWSGQKQPSFEEWRREIQAYIESAQNSVNQDKPWPGHLLIVCGFNKEAEIAAKLTEAVIPSGGSFATLEQGLAWMRAKMPTAAALSFGLAGALDPSLKIGDLVCAREVSGDGTIIKTDPAWTEHIARVTGAVIVERAVGRDAVVANPAAKAQLRAETGGGVIDMESHRLARWAQKGRLPMAVLRVVSDTANDVIPSSALAGFDGPEPNVKAVLGRLAQRPWELPGLIRMAVNTEVALRELNVAAFALGRDPGMAF